MSKSVLYAANTAAQAVADGGTIGIGNVIRRYGCGIDLNGNGIIADEAGYYDVAISVTAEPTVAGTITATLYNNGVAVPGATASATAAAAGDPVNLAIDSIIRVFCNGNFANLTIVLTGGAASVTNAAITVIKV